MRRLLAPLALATTVGMAHAVVFNFQSNGTASLTGATVAVNEPNLTQYTFGTTPGYTFSSLNYSYSALFAPGGATGTVTGTGQLALKNPANVPGLFDFTFNGPATRQPGDAMANTLGGVSFSQLAITLVPDPATPGFTTGMIGSGNFSGNKTGGQSATSFVSSFQPVPEPASVVGLGLAALASLRRRRRA